MKFKKSLIVLAASMILASCGGNPGTSTPDDKTSDITTSEIASSSEQVVSSSEGIVTSENTTSSEESSVSSSQESTAQKYKILSAEYLSGDTTVSEIVVDTSKEYLPGETVTMKIMPGGSWATTGFYYTNKSNIYVHVNDMLVRASLPEDQKDSTNYVTHFEASFKMPEENVEIVVVNNQYNYTGDNGHKVTIVTEGGVKVYGFDPQIENYTAFVLTIKRPESSYVTAEYSLDGEATWQELEMDKNSQTGEVWKDNIAKSYYKYAMVTADCVVKIKAVPTEAKVITYEGSDDIVTTDDKALQETCMPGDIVTINYKEKDGKNYTDPATIKGVSESAIRTNNENMIQFTMPNNPITITFNVHEGIAASITTTRDVLEAELSRSPSGNASTSFKPGSTVYLNATRIKLRTGKLVSKVLMNGVEMEYSSGYMGAYYYATAPMTGTIEITIQTSASYKVQVNAVEGGTVTISGSIKETTPGTTVSGSISAKSTHTFDHFIVKDALDNEKTDDLKIDVVVGDYSTTFSFVMPEYDVYLTPVWTELDSYQITLDLTEDDYSKLNGVDPSYNRSCINSSKTYQYDYFPRLETETPKSYVHGEKLGVTLNVKDANSVPQIKWTDAKGNETILSATSSYASSGFTNYTFANWDAKAYAITSATTFSIIWTAK